LYVSFNAARGPADAERYTRLDSASRFRETKPMAGPFHDFLVLSLMDYDYADYMDHINTPSALRIHDDLINYIGDTLIWIPCYNPAQDGLPRHNGLNLFGPTIIKADGAEIAWKVFRCWAELFSNGPKKIQLTGHYILNPGQEELQVIEARGGPYEKLIFDRNAIVKQFNKLASYCYEVIEGGDEVFMLHLGI
jgi:hypothetical protein